MENLISNAIEEIARGRRNGFFFFSRGQQKIYCGCYHWDIPHFAPRVYFFFFFFVYFVLKKFGRMAEQVEKFQVEMESPEKQTKNGWNGGRERGSLYSLFSERVAVLAVQLERLWVEMEAPRDWARESLFPTERKKKKLPEGCWLREKLKGKEDSLMKQLISNERINFKPTMKSKLEEGSLKFQGHHQLSQQ